MNWSWLMPKLYGIMVYESGDPPGEVTQVPMPGWKVVAWFKGLDVSSLKDRDVAARVLSEKWNVAAVLEGKRARVFTREELVDKFF